MLGAWPEIEFTWAESFNLKIKADMETNDVIFCATIPDNTYLSIAFGSDMIAADMILWQADGDESEAYDMWSSNFATPMFDQFDQLITEIEDGKIGTGTKQFTTRRPYDPMDD